MILPIGELWYAGRRRLLATKSGYIPFASSTNDSLTTLTYSLPVGLYSLNSDRLPGQAGLSLLAGPVLRDLRVLGLYNFLSGRNIGMLATQET